MSCELDAEPSTRRGCIATVARERGGTVLAPLRGAGPHSRTATPRLQWAPLSTVRRRAASGPHHREGKPAARTTPNPQNPTASGKCHPRALRPLPNALSQSALPTGSSPIHGQVSVATARRCQHRCPPGAYQAARTNGRVNRRARARALRALLPPASRHRPRQFSPPRMRTTAPDACAAPCSCGCAHRLLVNC